MADCGGYEYKFVDTPPDDVICQICQYPSREPYLSVCCGHVFCKSCFERCVEGSIRSSVNPEVKPVCPVCRSTDFQGFPNKQADRNVRNIHVLCASYQKGCQWQGEINAIGQHLNNDCQFHEMLCPSNCGKLVLRSNLSNHREQECACRIEECEHCHLRAEYCYISSQHLNECRELSVACPNKCAANNILRKNLNAHEKVCPLAQVKCKYYEIGCTTLMARKDEKKHNKQNDEHHYNLVVRYCDTTKSQLANRKHQLADRDRQLAIKSDQLIKANSELSQTKSILAGTNYELAMVRNQSEAMKFVHQKSINTKQRLAVVQQQLINSNQNLANTQQALYRTQQELTNNKQMLTEALTSTQKELTNNKQKLANAQQILTSTQKELTDNKQKLVDTQQMLSSKQKELTNNKQMLTEALTSTQQELTNNKQKLANAQQILTSTQKELTNNKQKLVDTQQMLSSKQKELTNNNQKLANTQQLLTSTQKEITSNKRKLSYTQQALDVAQDELVNHKQKLACTQQSLANRQRELYDKEWRLEDAQQRLDDAQEGLTNMERITESKFQIKIDKIEAESCKFVEIVESSAQVSEMAILMCSIVAAVHCGILLVFSNDAVERLSEISIFFRTIVTVGGIMFGIAFFLIYLYLYYMIKYVLAWVSVVYPKTVQLYVATKEKLVARFSNNDSEEAALFLRLFFCLPLNTAKVLKQKIQDIRRSPDELED
ncbi:TNF receptor-associated factor family protein DDB_G0290965-like [Dysidea avara]|uniref:TNF receptor-associated factor family protein DDB_G0290965-like n=1 Tax=Dysidea avara TaxID=196820 RepID=UPI003330EC34